MNFEPGYYFCYYYYHYFTKFNLHGSSINKIGKGDALTKNLRDLVPSSSLGAPLTTLKILTARTPFVVPYVVPYVVKRYRILLLLFVINLLDFGDIQEILVWGAGLIDPRCISVISVEVKIEATYFSC